MKKTASRPLLSIEDTIHTRLSMNLEFKFWVENLWPGLDDPRNWHRHPGRPAVHELRRTMMAPLRLVQLMGSKSYNGEPLRRREHDQRACLIPEIYDKESELILKYAGETY